MATHTNNNIRSEDITLRFFTAGNKEIVLNHMTINIAEQATEGADSICGRRRDATFTVTNYWDVTFDGTQTDIDLIDEYLANIIAKDAGTGENPAVATFQAKTKKGVTRNYVFSGGITRKPLALSGSGRSDPFKVSTGFKCDDFEKSK